MAMKMFFFAVAAVLVMLAAQMFPCEVQGSESRTSPAAIRGVLDASSWNFSKQDPINLDGSWEFYWSQLLDPTAVQAQMDGKHYINLPRIWNKYDWNGKSLPSTGYATFALTVKINDQDAKELKALYMPTVSMAYRLFIDGKMVAFNGVVGKSKEEMKPQYLPQVVYFQPKSNSIHIVLQISNFFHYKGGIWKEIQLGNIKPITESRDAQITEEAFFTASLFVIGLFHIILFVFRRKEKTTLYFGLFCLLAGVRSILIGQNLLIRFYPDFNWVIEVIVEYTTLYFLPPAFILYIYSLYPHEISKKLVRFSFAVAGLFFLQTILLPMSLYTWTVNIYYVHIVIIVLYVLVVMAKTAKQKRELALLNFIVALIFVATVLTDILYYSGFIRIGNVTPYGEFLFIFTQSVGLSGRFSKAFRTVELMTGQLQELNMTLEEKVKERTRGLEISLHETAAAKEEMSILAERNRIAGEIHDIVGHTLTTTIIQIEAGKRLVEKNNISTAIENLELSQELIRNGLHEIRKSVRMIKEESDAAELRSDLVKLIEDTIKHTGLMFTYSIDPLPELSAYHKKLIYHALQEGITNGIRHGESTVFEFTLENDDNTLFFTLVDNGCGFEKINFGFGLITMKSRVEPLGGQLTIISEGLEGCRLSIILPLKN